MIQDISAEMLLGYLYPDRDNFWKAEFKGTFYRNYNDDCITFDPETGVLELARDGFLKTLPDGLLTNPEEVKSKDPDEKWDQDLKDALLAEAFSPFDAFAFRDNLKLEKIISSLLNEKVEFVLKNFFDIDLNTLTDPLVREAALMLPTIYRRRGNPHFVKVLLASLLHCEVELDLSHRFSEGESDKVWIPKAIYTLVIPSLTPDQFREKYESLQPLVEFIRDRMMPFDIAFELKIRDYADSQVPDDERCLDYNLQIR